jgi:hypothetical protein
MVITSHTSTALHCANNASDRICTRSFIGPVAVALTIVFGYELLMPLALWVIMKWKETPVTILDLICLFGYSFAVFVPGVVLSLVPWAVVKWPAGIATFTLSTLHILGNLYGVWHQHLDPQWVLGVIGFVTLVQAGLTMTLHGHFFM